MKEKMKKVLLLLLTVIAVSSCSVDNDLPDYHYEVLPVESFTVPSSFRMGGLYEIKIRYKRPTDCHFLDGIYYDKIGNTRTIGVQTTVLERSYCLALDEVTVETSFLFECTGGEKYIFKFYKGADENGNYIFESVEIPVNY
jgi:hypothetical protein